MAKVYFPRVMPFDYAPHRACGRRGRSLIFKELCCSCARRPLTFYQFLIERCSSIAVLGVVRLCFYVREMSATCYDDGERIVSGLVFFSRCGCSRIYRSVIIKYWVFEREFQSFIN